MKTFRALLLISFLFVLYAAHAQSPTDQLVAKKVADKVSEQQVLDNKVLYTYQLRFQGKNEYINEDEVNIVVDERLALGNILWCKVEREEGTMKIVTTAGVELSDIIVMKESPCFRKQNQGLVIDRGVVINCPDKIIKNGVIIDKPAKTYKNSD